MTHKYKLVGRVPVPVDDVVEWATAMEESSRSGELQIGIDMVGNIEVSTIFMGLDAGYFGTPRPFETMTFRWNAARTKREAVDTWRYTTFDEAEAGHREIVDTLKATRH